MVLPRVRSQGWRAWARRAEQVIIVCSCWDAPGCLPPARRVSPRCRRAEARQGRRFELHDLQNARVEVIDLLFFWVSMAQCVGLTAEEVHGLYTQKLSINHKRQDNDYSMKHKDEADNKAVTLK